MDSLRRQPSNYVHIVTKRKWPYLESMPCAFPLMKHACDMGSVSWASLKKGSVGAASSYANQMSVKEKVRARHRGKLSNNDRRVRGWKIAEIIRLKNVNSAIKSRDLHSYLERCSSRGSCHHDKSCMNHTLAQNCHCEFGCGMHETCKNTNN